MSSEPQGTANVRASKLLDVVKLLPSVGWALMSAVAFPAYAGMGWYTPAILAVVSTFLSAGFAYEVLTYHRRCKYVVARHTKLRSGSCVCFHYMVRLLLLLAASLELVASQPPPPPPTRATCRGSTCPIIVNDQCYGICGGEEEAQDGGGHGHALGPCGYASSVECCGSTNLHTPTAPRRKMCACRMSTCESRGVHAQQGR